MGFVNLVNMMERANNHSNFSSRVRNDFLNASRPTLSK